MSKRVIAVDIDDVLAASAEGWVRYSNERWGTNLTVADYTEDWAEMWGVDRAEEEKRARELHGSGLFGSFAPDQRAMAVLRKLSRRYELVIATSRVMKVHQDTLNWLQQHYQGIFSGVHMSGIFDKVITDETHRRTKAELCRDIGADFLIDDQLKHCVAVAEVGMEAIIFGDYPWNQSSKPLPERVTRCADWTAVGEYFDARG